MQGLQRGTLTLGIMQTPSLFDLPGLIARYRSAYPGIELRVQQASAPQLGRMLADHDLDVIFRAVADQTPDLVSIPLASSPLVVICNPAHPLAGSAAVDLRALSGGPLVCYPLTWTLRTLSDRAFRSSGVEPHYAFEVTDALTLLDFVEIGLCVALFPEAIATSISPGLREIPISHRRWDWTLRAETLPPGPPNPAARALWAMLADQQ